MGPVAVVKLHFDSCCDLFANLQNAVFLTPFFDCHNARTPQENGAVPGGAEQTIPAKHHGHVSQGRKRHSRGETRILYCLVYLGVFSLMHLLGLQLCSFGWLPVRA